VKPYYETKLGKLYHGDCLEIMPELEPVDLVLTDPPYFIPAQFYVNTREGEKPKRSLSDISILKTYFKILFNAIDQKLNKHGSLYMFCDGQSYPIFYEAAFPFFKHTRPLIWDKKVGYNGYTWRHQHELILWGECSDSKRIPTGEGDILRHKGVLQKDRLHPAEKPVTLMAQIINKHSQDDTIADFFCGSGPVLSACEQLNRKWIGCEISEKYCEIAAKRLEQETAQLKLFTG